MQNVAPFGRHFHGRQSVLLGPAVWARPCDCPWTEGTARQARAQAAASAGRPQRLPRARGEHTPADGPEGHEERGRPDAPRVHATPAAVEQAFGIS